MRIRTHRDRKWMNFYDKIPLTVIESLKSQKMASLTPPLNVLEANRRGKGTLHPNRQRAGNENRLLYSWITSLGPSTCCIWVAPYVFTTSCSQCFFDSK